MNFLFGIYSTQNFTVKGLVTRFEFASKAISLFCRDYIMDPTDRPPYVKSLISHLDDDADYEINRLKSQLLCSIQDTEKVADRMLLVHSRLHSEDPHIREAAIRVYLLICKKDYFLDIVHIISSQSKQWFSDYLRFYLINEFVTMSGEQWPNIAEALANMYHNYPEIVLDLARSVLTLRDLEDLVVWL